MPGRQRLGVTGLSQFRSSLRRLDREAAKGLRLALNDAAQLLVDEARPLIPSRTGAARASLKARSTQGAVRVAYGGRKAPYMPWLDFGGRTGPARSVARPFLSEGRYLYPTLRRNRSEFEELLLDRIAGVARAAGVEVS